MDISNSPVSPIEIAAWINDEYNHGIETYTHGEFVRLTNGSAAFYLYIRPTDNGRIRIHGERYGDVIEKTCGANRDDLISTLANTI